MGFREAALTNPEKTAIVMVESGERRTFRELSERADQYANFFRQNGCVAAELIAYCREQLSPIKCPKTIDFIEALPRHATGKLYKRLLKDQYRDADANSP